MGPSVVLALGLLATAPALAAPPAGASVTVHRARPPVDADDVRRQRFTGVALLGVGAGLALGGAVPFAIDRQETAPCRAYPGGDCDVGIEGCPIWCVQTLVAGVGAAVWGAVELATADRHRRRDVLRPMPALVPRRDGAQAVVLVRF